MFHYLRYLLPIYFKKRPIHITLFITNRCNARCRFCFYEINRDGYEMTLEEYRAVARNLWPILWLSFSGGEISLRKDLPEIAEAFYLNTRPTFILLSTNGLLPERIKGMTEEICLRCRHATVVLKVSLDGVGSVHDMARGVKGAFEKALKTISLVETLKKRFKNLQLGINTVLYSGNASSIKETIEFVNGLKGIQVHTISLIRGRPAKRYGISAEVYESAIKTLKGGSVKRFYSFSGARLKTAQDNLQRRLIEDILRGRPFSLGCTAGRLSLVLTEKGEVYPCESFNIRLGNLRQWGYDLKRLLAEGLSGEVKGRISHCYCTHECNMLLNIFASLRAYPRLFVEYLKLLGLFSQKGNGTG